MFDFTKIAQIGEDAKKFFETAAAVLQRLEHTQNLILQRQDQLASQNSQLLALLTQADYNAGKDYGASLRDMAKHPGADTPQYRNERSL